MCVPTLVLVPDPTLVFVPVPAPSRTRPRSRLSPSPLSSPLPLPAQLRNSLRFQLRLEPSVKSVPLKNFIQAYTHYFYVSDGGRIYLAGTAETSASPPSNAAHA